MPARPSRPPRSEIGTIDLINAAELAGTGIFEDVVDGPEPEPRTFRALVQRDPELPVGPSAADRAWHESYVLHRDGETPEDPDGRYLSDAEFHGWHSSRRAGIDARKRIAERAAAKFEAESEKLAAV